MPGTEENYTVEMPSWQGGCGCSMIILSIGFVICLEEILRLVELWIMQGAS